MSRPPIDRATRERVKHYLIHCYGLSHDTSGEVKVTSLGFSNNPRHWRLDTKSRAGEIYNIPNAGWHSKDVAQRNDIHIKAVLSPNWIDQPLTSTLFNAEQNHHHVVAGVHELSPPEGVDRVELLCMSTFSKLHLTSRYLFRFSAAGLTGIPNESFDQYPPKGALGLMHGKFNEMVAAAMAHRLTSRKPSTTRATVKGLITWEELYAQQGLEAGHFPRMTSR